MRGPALALVAALAGCQGAPAPVPQASAPADVRPAPGADLRAEGDALMAGGRYGAAAERYRAAVALAPADAALRFALGTAYSHLDRRADAVEQMRVVLARGAPGSLEYREARRWLVAAGAPVGPEPAAPGGLNSPAVEAPGTGRLVGRTEWPGIDPRVRLIRGEISIAGVEAVNETIQRSRPFRLGDRYYFYDIPPGQYRIVARSTGLPANVTLWDQRVAVQEGTPTEVVLTPATARVSPEKFPPPPAD
jgi:tetratricopeptide (TPR) repeat protein